MKKTFRSNSLTDNTSTNISNNAIPNTTDLTSVSDTTPTINQSAKNHPPKVTQSNILFLQRTIGNQAVTQLLRKNVTPPAISSTVIQRFFKSKENEKWYLIAGTKDKPNPKKLKIELENKAEYARAVALVKAIKELGMELDSRVGQKLEKDNLVNQKEKDKITTESWKVFELEAIYKALLLYKPHFDKVNGGKVPAEANIKTATLSKITTAKNINDRKTLAWTIKSKGNISFTNKSNNFVEDIYNPLKAPIQVTGLDKLNQLVMEYSSLPLETTIQATALHELSHLVIEDEASKQFFIKSTGYWDPAKPPKGAKGWDALEARNQKEQPVTPYGKENPDEDMAETIAYFFMGKEMKVAFPLRYAAVIKLMPEATAAFLAKQNQPAVNNNANAPQANPGMIAANNNNAVANANGPAIAVNANNPMANINNAAVNPMANINAIIAANNNNAANANGNIPVVAANNNNAAANNNVGNISNANQAQDNDQNATGIMTPSEVATVSPNLQVALTVAANLQK